MNEQEIKLELLKLVMARSPAPTVDKAMVEAKILQEWILDYSRTPPCSIDDKASTNSPSS